MNFGGWLPLHDAPTAAPNAPGLLQARSEELTPYPKGRSAMVLYARCRPDETLRGYVAGRGAARLDAATAAGGRWIRFCESTSPDRDFERLLGRFVDRFGTLPVANLVEDDEPPHNPVNEPAGSRGASRG